MKELDLKFKNPDSVADETIFCFLAPKIIEIFRENGSKIHKNDLANLFFQRVRFNKQIFDHVLETLLEEGIVERNNRSAYLTLSREADND